MIKAQFKGTRIVPKDAVLPEIGGLKDEFGKEALAEFNGRVEKDYANARALQVLSYSDNVVKGSNPFAVVLMNSIVKEIGLRTATPADLEMALNDGIDLGGVYSDSALVLRNLGEPNEYFAKNLDKQLKAKGKIKYPIMIPLTGFDLAKDSNSPYLLDFKLRGDAEIIDADILNSDGGRFSSEDVDLKTGLPKKLGNGGRTLFTKPNGLSRVYLYSHLFLYSEDSNLVKSDRFGLVHLASTKGAKATQNFQAYLKNLEQAKAKEIAKIEKRYAKALNILKGK